MLVAQRMGANRPETRGGNRPKLIVFGSNLMICTDIYHGIGILGEDAKDPLWPKQTNCNLVFAV